MRKFLFLTCFLAGMLVACSNDADGDLSFDGNGGVTVEDLGDISDEIAIFFNKELPERHNDSQPYGYSTSFFYDFSIGSKEKIECLENVVRLINSNQELADIYQGENELPKIDFDKYTLIIGHQLLPCLGFYLTKKELVVSKEGLVMNLYTRNDREIRACMLQNFYFWGLYPKQSQNTVSVKCFMEYTSK